MRGTAARAVDIPWLAPGVPALVAFATGRDPASDPAVLADPAAVALLVRFSESADLHLPPPQRAACLRFARKHLVSAVRPPAAQAAHAIRCGTIASRLRPELSRPAFACAVTAWIGEFAQPGGAATVTRHLARSWRLPFWCASVLRNLVHPAKAGESLGADADLLAVTRAAIFLTQSDGAPQLIPGLDASTLDPLGLAPADAAFLADSIPPAPLAPADEPTARLLPELLALAERHHRRRRDDVVAELEAEADHLHAALVDQRRTEANRLHERKLTALAELAAGAGHEINTPLAIISGQAQLLLGDEEDSDRRRSLQTIVHQSRRVHDLLTGLMQFARPSPPVRQVLDLSLLVHEALAAAAETAGARGVRFERDLPAEFLAFADPRQVRVALGNLVRNAAEAAPDGGWVRVSGAFTDDGLEIRIDDSGSGPDPAVVEHLFDPFFCGRPAGRGRGLGLSTAWRLAKAQGGDVRYVTGGDGPTRFVLTLPRAEGYSAVDRLSA